MNEQRSTDQRRTDVATALASNGDVWLATADGAGRPHIIAVSSWWDGERIVVATRTPSRTASNLGACRLARLAVGSPDDAILIDADLVDESPVVGSADGLVEGFAAAVGWSPAEEDGEWRLFVLKPMRIQAYRGYSEQDGRDVMRDGRWVG